MKERTILADCCEEWIIQWGGFYEIGRDFGCPECGTAWRKSGSAAYARGDGRGFERRERGAPGAAFPYLAPTDGDAPDVERCCATILLSLGERMSDGSFACPVCGTGWQRRRQRLHGLSVPVFEHPGLAEPLTIQSGRYRSFLVRLSEYSPPRY